jgi:hypothetical protein
MRIEQTENATTIHFDEQGTGRICGSCQLCCKLVPVPEIHKAAGTRCEHSKAGHGCTIYAARPFACRTWSCRWLADPETAGMPRPDRCHYVIDLVLDYITAITDDGKETEVPVLQVWVDPAFPEAHRAPELRAYMLQMAAKHRLATIVRYDSRRAFMIFPPPITGVGWIERTDGKIVSRDPIDVQVLEDFDAAKKEKTQ